MNNQPYELQISANEKVAPLNQSIVQSPYKKPTGLFGICCGNLCGATQENQTRYELVVSGRTSPFRNYSHKPMTKEESQRQ